MSASKFVCPPPTVTSTVWWDPFESWTSQHGLEPLLFLLKGMPCLESSSNTLSIEGGLRPIGKGSHGLFIASFTALSTTSSACINEYNTFQILLEQKSGSKDNRYENANKECDRGLIAEFNQLWLCLQL